MHVGTKPKKHGNRVGKKKTNIMQKVSRVEQSFPHIAPAINSTISYLHKVLLTRVSDDQLKHSA